MPYFFGLKWVKHRFSEYHFRRLSMLGELSIALRAFQSVFSALHNLQTICSKSCFQCSDLINYIYILYFQSARAQKRVLLEFSKSKIFYYYRKQNFRESALGENAVIRAKSLHFLALCALKPLWNFKVKIVIILDFKNYKVK